MKKRACAVLMALVMLLSLLPATAMAAGETEYTVGSAEDLTDAYEAIKGQSEDEATIILTADITTNTNAIRGDSSTDPLDEIDNYVLGDTNVIFNGVGTESYWGIGTVKAVNHVILENNTQVCGRTACLLNGVGKIVAQSFLRSNDVVSC